MKALNICYRKVPMQLNVWLVSTISIIVLMGCDGTNSGANVGEEGAHCYPNNTCDDGLTCVSGVCVRLPGQDSSTDLDGACLPDCRNVECGDDGCGGSCGNCESGFECRLGMCFAPTCTPDCDGHECGTDGCGGTCGACDDGLFCTNDQCIDGACQAPLSPGFCLIGGACVPPGAASTANPCQVCVPGIATDVFKPALDGENCGAGMVCFQGACCDRAANCASSQCGSDGCGGTCGSCGPIGVWEGGACVPGLCTADCSDSDCGDDGCGGVCGTCGAGSECSAGKCVPVCTPDCVDRECGDDGCGGACGACDDGLFCTSDSCQEGRCVVSLLPLFCLIDGQCAAAGSDAPANPCAECAPSTSTSQWSPKVGGSVCGLGQVCYQAACCDHAGNCTDRQCGNDGCGGTCGVCPTGWSCQQGICTQGSCTASCVGVQCGDDGCGGSCGDCAQGEACKNGTCEFSVCIPQCQGKQCGSDGCGGVCGVCDDDAFCTTDLCMSGTCTFQLSPYYCLIEGACASSGAMNPVASCQECMPAASQFGWSQSPDGDACGSGSICYQGGCCARANHCAGKSCGDDGCGGVCGNCSAGFSCQDGTCVPGICTPDCAGKNCGGDSCGGSCGQCDATQQCLSGQCSAACTPACGGQQCGPDGCGGSCGECDDGIFCTSDACVNGQCTYSVLPYFCLISGACIASGAYDPNAPCKQCRTLVSKTQWSLADDGMPCGTGKNCSAGVCQSTVCVPNCAGKTCGNDGCGGTCGSCDDGLPCTTDQCVNGTCSSTLQDYYCLISNTCVPDGASNLTNGCQICDPVASKNNWTQASQGYMCGAGKVCNQGQCCDRATNCLLMECGDDGCGGTCGTCALGYGCNLGQCEPGGCTPDCVGKECGPDGCGSQCGTCNGLLATCQSGVCQCTPDCNGKSCGDDGCGGTCGSCETGQFCINGICPAPGLECDDGNTVVADGCENNKVTEWIVWPGVTPYGYGTDPMSDCGVTPLADGGYFITWVQMDAYSHGIYGLIFDAQGKAQGDRIRLNTTQAAYQLQPRTVQLENGTIVATWVTGSRVVARSFDAHGSPTSSEFEVSPLEDASQTSPTIGLVGQDKFAIAWTDAATDPKTFWSLFDSSLVKLTEVPYGGPTYSGLADAKGAFTLDLGTAGLLLLINVGGDVSGLFRTAQGEPISSTKINTYTTGTQTWSDAAILSDGSILVGWNSDGQDGNENGVYVQRITTTGEKLGSETRINEETNNAQYGVRLIPTGDLSFTAFYNSYANYSNRSKYRQFVNYLGTWVPMAELNIALRVGASSSGIDATRLADGSILVVFLQSFTDYSRCMALRMDPNGKPLYR